MPEFLDVIYAEQGIIISSFVYSFTQAIALREEDNSDTPDDYIEQCMGRQEPIQKVCIVTICYVLHIIIIRSFV